MKQHVVDDDDGAVVDVHGDLRLRQFVRDVVVAIQVDVDEPELGRSAADPFDLSGEAAGQRFTAAANAEQDQTVLRVFGLDHLVRDPRDRARDLGAAGEHPALALRFVHPRPFSDASSSSARASSAR